jgi:hypothetical protein
MTIDRKSLAIVAIVGSAVGVLAAQGHPSHVIRNGEITARVYLPDAAAGFYRSTRFDWSGAIASLQYKGHEYYGNWFAKITDIYDFGYDEATNDVISAEFTAMVGTAEEFGVIGYNEAKPGGVFVKPGIGALRRADETPYNRSKPYEIANGGKWEVERRSDSIQFVHTLKEPSIDFGYVYTKVIALTSGKPQLTIAHVLKNTGATPIRTNVYNHNFTSIDKQPPGPDYEIAFPFQVQRAQRGARGPGAAGEAARGVIPGGQGPATVQGATGGQGGPGGGRGLNPPNGSQCGRPEMQVLAAAQGNRLVYSKTLEERECFQAGFIGFGPTASDHDIRIEHKNVGAGVRITGDRPLLRFGYWSIRTVLAPEPYIDVAVEPGQEFTWKWTYDYFVTK